MSQDQDTPDAGTEPDASTGITDINRRGLLRNAGVASAAGLVGLPGFTGSAMAGKDGGGPPCHKSEWDCPDDSTYVKFEFKEEEGKCWFEEETDTGLIEITDWESKEGEECEPIYVEWESDTHFATKVMAFGGDDCDTVEDPQGSYNADQEEEDGLDTPSGQTAAISNLQFCLKEPLQLPARTYIGYEDRPDTGDFDYNDFGMRADIEETYPGGTLSSINMRFEATVKLAADYHLIHIERTFPDGVTYDYTVSRPSGSGTAVGSDATPAGTVEDASGDLDVILFDTPGSERTTLDDVVEITVEIKSGTVTPPSSSPRPDVGAKNPLFEVYDPYMENEQTDDTITITTVRDNIDKPEPDWDTVADVPNILVVPDLNFDEPDEDVTITADYPVFDDYYADSNDDPNDSDGDLEVDPTHEDWFK